MEEKRVDESVQLASEKLQGVSGGAKGEFSGGYCPYTTDRNCKVPSVGGWDNENEDCKYCGWRAW